MRRGSKRGGEKTENNTILLFVVFDITDHVLRRLFADGALLIIQPNFEEIDRSPLLKF